MTRPAGAYGTEARIMEMLTPMRDGRFRIGIATLEWQAEFQGCHRKNGLIAKANDAFLSATRIVVIRIRSAGPAALGDVRAGETSGRRQLRTRFEDPRHDQSEDEIAAAAALRAEEPVEADLARAAEGGSDVAVRQGAGDGEGVALGGNDAAAPQHTAQAFDIRGRPL
ncbi:MAG: hypothetical protein ACREFO_18395 [Acetobacteraceae bacterium]